MFYFILLAIFLFGSFEHIASLYVSSSKSSIHTTTMFSARIIHRSSPDSPFFDSNYTRNDHIKSSVASSLARIRYFSQSKARSDDNYIAAPISGWSFIMKYSMGTPPVDRYGILDTASSLTWFQCLPCRHCYNQGKLPLFNPKQSASYQQVFCYTSECDQVPRHMRWTSSYLSLSCRYYMAYVGGSSSEGIVSMETLTLSADDSSTESIDSVVFGCGNDNHDNEGIPGVIGVGNNSLSLLQQLSVSHFSYFFFANGSEINGEAHFGPGASLSGSGANTPFSPSDDGFYYLNLIGISVDGSDLDLPPGFFDKSIDAYGVKSGFIIDSGTTYTTLAYEAFDKLKDAIADAMHMYTQVKNRDFEVCFKGYRGGAPEVVFQFRGLDYVMCDANLWVRHHGLHCLAMVREKDRNDKISILGIHQQRNVQVGYDLEKNLLTLNYPEECPDDVIDFL